MSSNQHPDDNNMLSPNLTRYLNAGRTQTKPGRIIQQQGTTHNVNVQQARWQQMESHASQQTAATINKAGKKKKRTIAKKNLVIMCPSKHMDQAEDELNTTQLLFSPGATDGQVVHSMFSPPANNNTAGGLPSIDVDDLAFSPITCERMDQLAQRSHERNATVKHNETSMLCGDDYTLGQNGNQAEGNVVIQIETGPEKENMPPPTPHMPQQNNGIRFSPPAETRSNPKTPAKLDESSIDSLGEFFTPCPKTPGTKSSSNRFASRDETSYESLNTTRESKQHLLASHENVLKGGSWEGSDQSSWGEQEPSVGDMVFITPKQRDGRRNEAENSSSSDEDEFFSPLAQYNPQTVNVGEDLLEGSSVNLMNEVKILLSSKPDRKTYEYGEDEFFSPLTEHVPSNQTHQPILYSEVKLFDQSTPIPTGDKCISEDEPFEEGSTYRFINDAKSILAASKPETQTASNFDSAGQVPSEQSANKEIVRRTNNIIVNNSFDTEADKPFTDFIPTPTPKVEQSEVTAKQLPMFTDTSNCSPNNQNSLHLPQSVSALPPGALTVDFVRNCECIATLNTILSVLNGSKRGKHLRQPRLVQFVQKRLAKLNPSKDVTDDAPKSFENNKRNDTPHEESESQWQHFHHDNEWNLKLPPRITTGSHRSGKRIVWREDVKDNADSSEQSSLSKESIFQEPKHDTPDNVIVSTIPVENTPKTVEVSSLTVPTSSPSIHLSSVAESSLDMNLSESFTLGDESAYWRTVEETIQEEIDPCEVPPPTESLVELELVRELDEIRQLYNEAKEDVSRLTDLLKQSEKQKSLTKQTRNDGKLSREIEAARLANRALANTLAVSEKDLADAIEARDIKAQECEQLTTKVNETHDRNDFLASKVKKLETELASCNSYIDSLYAELQKKSSSCSNDLETELKKREVEWLELESRYSSTIEKLQAELSAQEKKVSMEMYLSIMKESRRHKMDAAEKQCIIDELRDEIQKMQRPPSKQGLKSISSLHNKIRSSAKVSPTGNQLVSKENLAPSNIVAVKATRKGLMAKRDTIRSRY